MINNFILVHNFLHLGIIHNLSKVLLTFVVEFLRHFSLGQLSSIRVLQEVHVFILGLNLYFLLLNGLCGILVRNIVIVFHHRSWSSVL